MKPMSSNSKRRALSAFSELWHSLCWVGKGQGGGEVLRRRVRRARLSIFHLGLGDGTLDKAGHFSGGKSQDVAATGVRNR